MARRKTYTGKINRERNGVTPGRGQGISSSRSIRLKGGRQLITRKGLASGATVKFRFPETKDRKTQYNYIAELV